MAQQGTSRILNDNWQELQLEIVTGELSFGQSHFDGQEFTTLSVDGFFPSSVEGSPCLPLFSRLIEVPLCDGFEVSVRALDYDTLMLLGARLMPAQPSRSKSDTTAHALVINEKEYNTDAFFGFETASVEAVGIARDRNLARLQFSPVRYNPVSGQLVVCRRAVVTVRYRNADEAASRQLFERYFSPHFASGAMAMNSLYPKSVATAAPLRYLIVAHSSFRGHLDEFVSWKRRKGFITDIVYTDSAAVGNTTSTISAFVRSQYTNATAEKPAPTYVLFVGDHEQIPAFTGTTSTSHITDLYYISWTTGDNIPDCYSGRFSAQNVEQLMPQVQKTLMYERYTFSDPSFLNRVVLVAGVDGGSEGDYGYTHADPAMDYAATHYVNATRGFTQVMYFKNNQSIVPSASGITLGSNASSNSATVRGYYNQGAGFINYSAHGSATSWGTPNFTTTHVASMTNTQKFGLMIGNCCLTNKFETATCFGEALLRKGNYCGAVGYIGGSNSTYWNEDFYWAVGLRSGISATMSMAYNANNLGAYDRLCHTHGEAYNQWALTQGAVMMVGNMAVESSTTSRKLYYWEIYHLMGDPSVMPYLTQAPELSVSAPTQIVSGTTTMSVSAVPYAYIALTDTLTHTLVAAAYANANGQATLQLPTNLTVCGYELAVWAQQYQPHFIPVTVAPPTGPFPVAIDVETSEPLVAGATVPMSVRVANMGNRTARNLSVALISPDNTALALSPAQYQYDSIAAGDTVLFVFQAHAGLLVPDGTRLTLTSSVSCDSIAQPVSGIHVVEVLAPAVTMTMTPADIAMQPGQNVTLNVVVSNNGHAPLNADKLTLASPTALLQVGGSTMMEMPSYTLAAGASETFSFPLHADNLLPVGISIPLTLTASNPQTPQPSAPVVYVGASYAETFEGGSFHTTGWTQGSYPWTFTTTEAHSGSYSLRSTIALTHSQTAQVSVSVTLATADSISFYYKVSSESNYDKFHFLIDNTDMITQSGEVEWTRAAFPVAAGNHTFTFTYAKDGSVNRNSDCSWIDNLVLPHVSHDVVFQSVDMCMNDTYVVNGDTLDTSTPRTVGQVNTLAGGNVQLVDYRIHPTYSEEHTTAVCDSLSWLDSVYTVSTDLMQQLTTVDGCDSLVMNHLTVNHSASTTIIDTCYTDSYLWSFGDSQGDGDTLFTESGTYIHILSTILGCDSVVTLQLTFADTTSVGVGEVAHAVKPVTVYPNPTQGVLQIDRMAEEVTLFDATGRLLLRRRQVQTLDIRHLDPGVYALRIVMPDHQVTVIRIVKQ